MINSLTPKSILVGIKKLLSKDFWLAKHTVYKYPHHDGAISPPAAWFCLPSVPHPWAPLRRGSGKVAFKWFSIKLQIKGEINKFLPVSL
jgi:hypothetical protein